MTAVRLMAALGSSYAAGPGIHPVADPAAARSEKNYPHLLAARLGARLVDLTVSGATTANLLDTPQVKDDGTVYPPQTDGIPADAELITITAGGNDLKFLPSLIYFAMARLMPGSELIREWEAEFANGIPSPTAEEVDRAASGLVRVIDKTRAEASGARIVLVNYLTAVADYSAAVTRFTEDEIGQFIALQDKVRQVFRDASARTGAELFLASAISEDHALGSPEPWLQPLTGEGMYHPNETGMIAVAAGLERFLQSG